MSLPCVFRVVCSGPNTYSMNISRSFLPSCWASLSLSLPRSLSLSLAGLLLPSTLTPVLEYSHALDIAFNSSIHLYTTDHGWCLLRRFPSTPSWEEWMWSWISPRVMHHDCDPILTCHSHVLSISPRFRPSALALQVPREIRVVSFRLRVEEMLSDFASAILERINSLYAKAVLYASEHPGPVCMCYLLFPTRLVTAVFKYASSRPRTRSPVNT